MIDVDKQIAYWRNSSLEDWEVAQELIALERSRHALFFTHLSVEKMLKAHIWPLRNDSINDFGEGEARNG